MPFATDPKRPVLVQDSAISAWQLRKRQAQKSRIAYFPRWFLFFPRKQGNRLVDL
jgi:hypothetical protein